MPVMSRNIGRDIPMGATLVSDGAVFRTWAPAARDVYVVTDAHATGHWSHWVPDPADRLFPLGDGTWAGFVPAISDGDPKPHSREIVSHVYVAAHELCS